jgi:hypothetical protein
MLDGPGPRGRSVGDMFLELVAPREAGCVGLSLSDRRDGQRAERPNSLPPRKKWIRA